MSVLRLDRIISDSGLVSRSEAANLIRSGQVTVDGVPVKVAAEKYDPEEVTISVSGRPLTYKNRHYIMMNKPVGVVSSTEDRRDKTVISLLDSRYMRLKLFPVGRLDKDTEGLLILTDDGEFAHKVTSPSKKVSKRYYMEYSGEITQEDISAFDSGLVLKDGTRCLPAVLESCGAGCAYITLYEGKYHQVKRMMAAIGTHVRYLKRISIGGLALDENLAPGCYRELTESEISAIFDNR